MNLKKAVAPLAIVAALGIAACGDDDSSDSGSSSDDASVSFNSPSEGAMTGDSVTAEVDLKNFEIDAVNVGKSVEEGKGHLHFSLDDGKYDHPKYSGANGDLAVKLGVDGQYSPAVEPKITYSGLPKGEHTLEVDLVNNDHSEDRHHSLDHVRRRVAMRVAGLVVIVAALGIPSSGCGGGDPPAGDPAPEPGVIEVRDFEFSPAEETFKVGEKATWENTGEQIHNVKGKGFFSSAMNSGDSYEFTFQKPGSYDYICTLHPQMKGTVVVE